MKFNLKLTDITVENITIGGVEYSSEYSTTEFRAIIDEFKTIVNTAPSFAQKIIEVVKLLEKETEPNTEVATEKDFEIEKAPQHFLYAVYYFGGDSTAFYERYPIGTAVPSTIGYYELDGIYCTKETAELHANTLMI